MAGKHKGLDLLNELAKRMSPKKEKPQAQQPIDDEQDDLSELSPQDHVKQIQTHMKQLKSKLK